MDYADMPSFYESALPPSAAIRHDSTINPADLHTDLSDAYGSFTYDDLCAAAANLPAVDSAVDLTAFPMKMEGSDQPLDLFADSLQASNTPSPSTDFMFSNTNSPGDFLRDHSQTSSPEDPNDLLSPPDTKPELDDEGWINATPDSINIPQSIDPPKIFLIPDKTKTRAETQIKVQLVIDPLDDRFEYIHFPRRTIAKPKMLYNSDETAEIESRAESLRMDVFLVCATAIEEKEQLGTALRRAAGKELIPRRPKGTSISDLDKDDPAHPQNGGEVLICEGCKERERKRYDRKKKRAEDEEEWWQYEDDRVIMINEKEYKKFKDADSSEQIQLSPRAKQVEFAMRIACYCRHQEEKTPQGYRVIFTFKDSNGALVAQHTSEIFQITDDHKNKDLGQDIMPRQLSIPTHFVPPQYAHAPIVVPNYQFPVDNQFTPTALGPYSQPPTPVMNSFQSPISPLDTSFPQGTIPPPPPLHRQHQHQPLRQNAPTFPGTMAASAAAASQLTRSQHYSPYDAPMLSPTTQMPSDMQAYIPRPVSMDNFQSIQYAQSQGFQSAPPSAVSTPINLSRPASPTWEQGPSKKRAQLRCVYFLVDEE